MLRGEGEGKGKGKGKGKSKGKGNRSVVAPFGLHSGLRQSGVIDLWWAMRPEAEASGYLDATATAKATAKATANANAKATSNAKAKATSTPTADANTGVSPLRFASVEMTRVVGGMARAELRAQVVVTGMEGRWMEMEADFD